MREYTDKIEITESVIDNLYSFGGTITYERINFLGEVQTIARFHEGGTGEVMEIGLSVDNEDLSEEQNKIKAYGVLLNNMGQETTNRRRIANEIKNLNNKKWVTKKDLIEASSVSYVYGTQIMSLFRIQLNRASKLGQY